MICLNVPETSHTIFLNSVYRDALVLLLSLNGVVVNPNCHFTTVEKIAFDMGLICLKWQNEV